MKLYCVSPIMYTRKKQFSMIFYGTEILKINKFKQIFWTSY